MHTFFDEHLHIGSLVQVTLDQYMAHEKLWYMDIQMGQIYSKTG
jgi:hypothetical protein